MDVSLSFILDYLKSHASLLTLKHCKCLAHYENLLEAHPLITASPVLCTSVLRFQVQQTWAACGYTTYKLNAFLEVWTLHWLQSCSCFWFCFKWFFFLISHLYVHEGEFFGGKWGKEEERKSSKLFPLNTRLQQPLFLTLLQPARYFLIPLDDFQIFWSGKNLQFSMRSATLVATSNSLLCLIKPPQ